MSSATVTQMNPALLDQLRPVLRRECLRRVSVSLAITWLLVALIGLLVLALNQSAESVLDAYLHDAWIWIAGLAAVGTVVAVAFAWFSMPTAQGIAKQVESQFPELDSVLLTAIEQAPDSNEGLSFFQYEVIKKAIHHSFEEKWASVVPLWKLLSSSAGAVIGLVGLVASCLMLLMMPAPELDESIHLFSDIEKPVSLVLKCEVQPGDVEVERGRNLLVLAEFPQDTPPKAELHLTRESGEERVIPMTKSLDDPVFAARIMQINQPLTYRVIFAEEESDEFQVTVFDYPQLLRSDVQLNFPKYTNLPEKKLQDTRRFSAVVGTQATLQFHLNKEVASATLRAKDENVQPIELSRDGTNPLMWQADLTVERSAKFRLHLVDAQQRENKSPPLVTIKALVNNPPELKLIEPPKDLAVSALEEVALSASVRDDFGLLRTGLAFSVGGSELREIELAGLQDGKEKHVVDHLLELESIDAEPDQLVSWHFWAEDLGPDGQPRRSESDMFFAEIRRYEEIFRQGQGGQNQQQQSQQGQGSEGAQQAAELAELEKQIINATWRVIRRERSEPLTDAFDADVSLILESQQTVAEQVDELIENLNDDDAKALAGELKSLINEAVDQIGSAKEEPSAKPLTDALRTQQSAWQAFLKMRASEIELQQSQQQQSSSSSSSQSARRQQLQQMELTRQEERYEQERKAEEDDEQARQQRENRQVLSRLRELARRQNDLNKRVKELQSAIEEAQTDEEKEELKKQLKRLEEEQQQLLRDTDELQERMEESQQQSEQMDQLEQARENVQRSSEALQQGDLSRAATEGTRAERELKELRDEFQKQTAGQFTEQMRQMRNETRDLQQQQEELSEKLKKEDDESPATRRLGGDDNREQLAEELREGKQQVERLREKIKDTIEEAEEFEPLLADELYETYRKSEQTRPDKALEISADSVERGLDGDAQQIHDIAMEGIEELRKGIDKAAESVLGDETEALKAARDTIKQLSRELDDEIKRNVPEEERERTGGSGTGKSPRAEREGEQIEEGNEGEGQPRGEQRAADERSDEEPESRGQNGGQRPASDPAEGEEGQRGEGERGESQSGQGQADQEQSNEGQAGQAGRAEAEAEANSPRDGQRAQGRRGGNRLDAEPSDERRQAGGAFNPNFGQNFAPITGDEFREWSDRLRDVEEMIADPDLRADAARIRDQAKAIRRNLKRHSPVPNWDSIELKLAKPLAELQSRVTQEILRRDPKNTLVPLNQEPVPARYQNAVRKYYETLGTGQ